MTFYYLSDNPVHLISGQFKGLVKDIADYAQKKLNDHLKLYGTEQLLYFDYEKFCTRLSKEFFEYNFNKTLEELFDIFQNNNKGDNKDRNKNIIKSIRNDRKENEDQVYLFINEFLDKNFYQLAKEFKEQKLTKYLEKKGKELGEAIDKNEKKNGIKIDNAKEKIEAYKEIFRILLENFKDYAN